MACTEKCRNSTSARCRCSCRGANHGQNVIMKAKKMQAMKEMQVTVVEKCRACQGTGIVEVYCDEEFVLITCPRCGGNRTVKTPQIINGGIFEDDEIPF